jgi:hypothetical protein
MTSSSEEEDGNIKSDFNTTQNNTTNIGGTTK